MPRVVTRTWSVTGEDGSSLSVSDTVEGGRVNVSIHGNGAGGRTASVALTEDQFEQLFTMVMGEDAFYTQRGNKAETPPLFPDVPEGREGRGRFARP